MSMMDSKPSLSLSVLIIEHIYKDAVEKPNCGLWRDILSNGYRVYFTTIPVHWHISAITASSLLPSCAYSTTICLLCLDFYHHGV